MGLLNVFIGLYENMRKTNTEVKENKPKARNYDFNSGFTGDKKTDFKIVTPTKLQKKSSDEKEIDER